MLYRQSGQRYARCYLAMFIAGLIAACAQTATSPRENDVSYVHNGPATLRIFVEGSGPTIVLLSGQGRGPADLDGVAHELVRSHYRVVRMDPRGFGESTGPVDITLRDNASDVAAIIKSLGSRPVIVAGWAYGNRIARLLAREQAELVRGIVLIAAGGKFPPATEVTAAIRVTQDKTVPAEKRAEAARFAFYGPASKLLVEDMLLDHSSDASIKSQSSTSIPMGAWWDGGSAPMLVIQGLNDVVAPPQNGRSLKEDYPQRVTLVELEGLGHRMVHERPDLVAKAIAAWAATIK